ncbi:MAG: glycosyltransferase, partial [Verrucomicrobia bacterium]|nr:glycosyltransferase [Verrucomicrobiota bacterium]
AKIARAINGTPVVFTVHGTSLFTPKPAELRPSLERRLEQWLVLRARYDHLITVANNFRALPNRNDYITVIPNGVDLSRFEPPQPWPAQFQLLYVGRFDPIKGVHVLIEAMAELKRRGRVPPLKLIGFGPQEPLLRKLVQRYKLEDRIQFAGKVTDHALVEAYGNCSLFVLPSLSEGQPLTLLEAWAARRPALATAVGDNPAYVRDGDNGFLAPSGDPRALADAIERAMGRSDLSALGERGYALVRERFSWKRVADQTFTIYNECLERHRAAAVPVRPKPPVAPPVAAPSLKVAMILDAWFPHVGGGQVHAWELAKRLVLNHGCEVDIVTRALCDEQNVPFTDNESHLDGRLRVWRLGAARHFEAAAARVAFLFHATRWLLRHQPDLIHAHTFLPAIPAKLARIFRRTPLVSTVHVT